MKREEYYGLMEEWEGFDIGAEEISIETIITNEEEWV